MYICYYFPPRRGMHSIHSCSSNNIGNSRWISSSTGEHH
nr:MAG TPA: hypothetical protein [Crassvirales sp.]